jgi:hypothetical protein
MSVEIVNCAINFRFRLARQVPDLIQLPGFLTQPIPQTLQFSFVLGLLVCQPHQHTHAVTGTTVAAAGRGTDRTAHSGTAYSLYPVDNALDCGPGRCDFAFADRDTFFIFAPFMIESLLSRPKKLQVRLCS